VVSLHQSFCTRRFSTNRLGTRGFLRCGLLATPGGSHLLELCDSSCLVSGSPVTSQPWPIRQQKAFPCSQAGVPEETQNGSEFSEASHKIVGLSPTVEHCIEAIGKAGETEYETYTCTAFEEDNVQLP